MRSIRLSPLPALAVLGLAACGPSSDRAVADTTEPLTDGALTLTPITGDLTFPWAMAFLPNGDMLVTERDGRLRIVRDGTLDPDPIANTPQDVYVDRQGGYLDVILARNFADSRTLFMSYSQGTDDSNRTAVIRARLNDDATALENVEEIFASHVPEKRGGAHFGSRLFEMPDGTLMVTLGDGFRWMDQAQVLDNHFGKVVRINTDGSVPEDNPFVGQAEARPEIYSYGHRNVQGLAYDEARGVFYTHEHGPKGGDELNIMEPGTNYGWPEITYGVNYDGTIITGETEEPGMARPAMKWVPSIAPSGMELYTGDVYPDWSGDLFIGAMNGPAGQKLVRVDRDADGNIVGREDLFADAGIPFRDVVQGPDGKLYLATADMDGMIYRLDRTD